MIDWHEGVKFPCVIIQTQGHLTPSHPHFLEMNLKVEVFSNLES